jgi:hypothetical protein
MIKKWRFTSGALGLLIAAIIGTVISEAGSSITALMVQFDWCSAGDHLCYLYHWGYFAGILIVLAITIDLSFTNFPKVAIYFKQPRLRNIKLRPGQIRPGNGKS